MTYHCWQCKRRSVLAPHHRCKTCERHRDNGHQTSQGEAPYEVAYNELVAKYGADVVAESMFAYDGSPDKLLARINREHVYRMREIAGIPHTKRTPEERAEETRIRRREERQAQRARRKAA